MSATVYRVDPTHVRLRLAVLSIIAIGFVIGLTMSLIAVNNGLALPKPFGVVIVGTVAIGVGLAAGWAAERYFTGRWYSGRTLLVTQEGVTLRERSGEETSIAWKPGVSISTWHFVVRKGHAWVPKGSYCVACQLTQDESVLIAYTFMQPTAALNVPHWNAFQELLSRRGLDKSGKKHALNEIGAQTELRKSEQGRWHFGVEMLPADFIELISELELRVADWPPSGQG